MKIHRILKLPSISLFILYLVSCSPNKLITSRVTYQSMRTTEYHKQIPEDAEIVVAYSVTQQGELVAMVVNKTNEVMIIDQTASFFVDTDGTSYSYYDPTIRSTTQTDINSTTKGVNVNLGAIGRSLGVGGIFGSMLSGINVGGSNTLGQSISNTTYFADQPQISLAPKGSGVMSKNFQISRLSNDYLKEETRSFVAQNSVESHHRFSVCISYSLDSGNTFKRLITDFYVNAQIIEMVQQIGEVNNALCNIYNSKQDALYEPLWIMYFVNNITSTNKTSKVFDSWSQGVLFDYK